MRWRDMKRATSVALFNLTHMARRYGHSLQPLPIAFVHCAGHAACERAKFLQSNTLYSKTFYKNAKKIVLFITS